MKKIVYSFILVLSVFIAYGQNIDKAKFDQFIETAYQKFQPAAVSVAIIKGDKIVYEKNIGTLNATSPEMVSSKSLYNIASCTKAFTAAAMAKLVEQGKLTWTTKVKEILPEFQLSDIYITNEMTIEDLLCHRSGFETFDGDLLWYGSNYTDQELLAKLKYIPITKAFRRDFGYQNNMYITAGMVIEKVSGKTWSEFVEQEFLMPLEMNETRTSNKKILKTDEVTTPHMGRNTMDLYDYNIGLPTAGIHASTSQLAHWVSMWLNKGKYKGKEILKETSFAYLIQQQTRLRKGMNDLKNNTYAKGYAMGWFVNDDNGQYIVEHDGGMPGYISKVGFIPNLGYGYVILNNGMDGYINSNIKDLILTTLLNKKGNDPIKNLNETYGIKLKNDSIDRANKDNKTKSRILNTKPSAKLESYAGTYEDKTWGIVDIKVQDDQLYFDMPRSPKIFKSKMKHFHNNTFEVNFNDISINKGYINFEVDSDNKIKGFKIDLESGDFWFYKLNFVKVK
jgi:CubicO group peptidase (beta-lactamase class C family)